MRSPTYRDFVDAAGECHKPGQSQEVVKEGIERTGLEVGAVMKYGKLVADAALPMLLQELRDGDLEAAHKTIASAACACTETGWRTHINLSREEQA
jgi:UDP-glucose 4-epimerase